MECQKSKVVELLKGASQTLVTLNSKEVPVSSLQLDIHTLTSILKELKREGVIDYFSGFWSYADGMVYPTSCSLSRGFFQTLCKRKNPKGQLKQLNLFEP